MGKTIRVYGFSSTLTAESVKDFMETYTGEKTVYAVDMGRGSRTGKQGTYAKVTFTYAADAKDILALIAEGLFYEGSYLEALEDDHQLLHKLQTFSCSIDNLVLNFGCQVSREKFCVLWTSSRVSLRFDSAMRTFYFFVSDNFKDYKLELSYGNIRQIELHHSLSQTSRFLVVQLLGAPRIYQKDPSHLKYFKEAAHNHWVRDVDFTTSGCIGQSSSLCLELPEDEKLTNFCKNFAFYTEYYGQFSLESGPTYSVDSGLVPIVVPPQGMDLPYKILFKVNSLVQHGYLSGPTLDINFFRMVDPRRTAMKVEYIEHTLDVLGCLKDCCYEPVDWLKEQYLQYQTPTQLPISAGISLYDGLVYVHRAKVTPSKIFFCGPEVSVSNRVLRHFIADIDNFLRVSFVDEELGKMFPSDLLTRTSANEKARTRIYERILSTLRDGIVIGDKHFQFLAFSSSQLRENSLWMFASRAGLTAADIRDWMGDFGKIRNVAKYAARLGQSFGSSMETLNVERDETEIIPDVETTRGKNRYVFSDGIGKLSAQFADEVMLKCGKHAMTSTPSAFQIRYAGFKGVVAVDPTSSMKLSLRSSMCKYESSNTELDVLAWSKYQPCFLNRQVITLLSTLGIEDYVFERKQDEAVAQLNAVLKDPLIATEVLQHMSPVEGSAILKEMLMCGYKPDAEPFLSMMLRTFCAAKLLEIRTKSRIYIPNGRFMMGCLDETGTLEYGQVFVQFSCIGCRFIQKNILKSKCRGCPGKHIFEGKVVVAKNPCLHPGDVRILQAIDVPDLHHMVDCIVFPQKGQRPHTDECSGSDLDGDVYFVCWDPDLIPSRPAKSMDYTPAPTMLQDHDIKIEEVMEFFANYMLNDNLGVIANAHTALADKNHWKALSKSCLDLAKLFSVAVDFPKTGVPAKIPNHLRIKEYPDFMEKPEKRSYESQTVIGKLFRKVKDIAPPTEVTNSFTEDVAIASFDLDLLVDGFDEYVADAVHYKAVYDDKLRSLMHSYDIKTEAEILSGSILTKSRSFDKKRDMEVVGYAVRSLRNEARSWFHATTHKSSSCFDDGDLCAKASAWYYVTYHPSCWGLSKNDDHFLSFPWCIYDKLLYLKKKKLYSGSSVVEK